MEIEKEKACCITPARGVTVVPFAHANALPTSVARTHDGSAAFAKHIPPRRGGGGVKAEKPWGDQPERSPDEDPRGGGARQVGTVDEGRGSKEGFVQSGAEDIPWGTTSEEGAPERRSGGGPQGGEGEREKGVGRQRNLPHIPG